MKGVGSGSTAQNQGSQLSHVMGISRSSVGIGDQAVSFLWNQGPQFVTLLKSRVRNLDTNMGSALKLHTSLRPCYKRPPKINSRKDGRVEEVAAYERFHPDISSRI